MADIIPDTLDTPESSRVAPPDFSELLLGFASAALYYLGEASVDNKKVEKQNLDLALQNIEILVLLELKSKGNTSEAEAELLKEILVDLKTKYALAKSQKK